MLGKVVCKTFQSNSRPYFRGLVNTKTSLFNHLNMDVDLALYFNLQIALHDRNLDYNFNFKSWHNELLKFYQNLCLKDYYQTVTEYCLVILKHLIVEKLENHLENIFHSFHNVRTLPVGSASWILSNFDLQCQQPSEDASLLVHNSGQGVVGYAQDLAA